MQVRAFSSWWTAAVLTSNKDVNIDNTSAPWWLVEKKHVVWLIDWSVMWRKAHHNAESLYKKNWVFKNNTSEWEESASKEDFILGWSKLHVLKSIDLIMNVWKRHSAKHNKRVRHKLQKLELLWEMDGTAWVTRSEIQYLDAWTKDLELESENADLIDNVDSLDEDTTTSESDLYSTHSLVAVFDNGVRTWRRELSEDYKWKRNPWAEDYRKLVEDCIQKDFLENWGIFTIKSPKLLESDDVI